MLIYLIGVAFTEQLVDPTFVHSFHTNVQDTLNPMAYEVRPEQMVVLSAISKNNEDWDFAEGYSVENYFGGVYI